MTEKLEKASMALILREGKVLAVSRKNDPTQMGLPGGKVDAGETWIDTVLREVKEETGLDVNVVAHLYDRHDEGFLGKTFLCEIIGEIPQDFQTNESGRVAWVEWQELFDGPFGVYNRNLFNHILNEYIKWKKLQLTS